MKRALFLVLFSALLAGSCQVQPDGGAIATRRSAIDLSSSASVLLRLLWQGSPVTGAEAGGSFHIVDAADASVSVDVVSDKDQLFNLSPGDHLFSAFAGSCTDARNSLGQVAVTAVSNTSVTADLDLTPTAGRVTGTLSAAGVPLPANFMAWLNVCGQPAQFQTDAAGHFSMLLPPGSQSVNVYDGAFHTLVWSFSFTVTPGQVTDLGTLAVPEGNVQGTFSWNGAPITAEDAADVSPVTIDLSALVPVAGNGYVLHGVPPGSHSVRAGGSRADFTVTANQTATPNLDLTSSFGRAIGTLLANGAPAPNVRLGFNTTDPSAVHATTSASGQFSVLLSPGTNFLFWALGSDGVEHSFSTSFSVVAGQTTNLGTIAMAEGGVQGTILFNGAPITAAEAATLQLSVGGQSFVNLPELASASFTVAGLSSGPTNLTAQSSATERVVGVTSVTVVQGSVVNADIDLTPNAGRVRGTLVAGSAAVPPSGIPVFLPFDFFHDQSGPLMTDASGSFAWLLALDDTTPIASAPATGIFGLLPEVNVQPGIDLDLGSIPLADVSGRLLWNGRPLNAEEASGAYWAGATMDSWTYVAFQFSGGAYSAHLIPGDYAMQILSGDLAISGKDGPLRCDPLVIPLASATFNAVAGSPTTADIELAGTVGRVAGTLTTNGVPLAGATIAITMENNFGGEAASPCAATVVYTAGANGQFSLFLPPGDYTGEVSSSTGFVGDIQLSSVAGQTSFVDGLPVPGTPCSDASTCADGAFCVDGVCCTSACGGGDASDCQACSVAAGGSANGTCTPLTSTTQICRPKAGPCDVAEICSPTSTTCPDDTVATPTTACYTAPDFCASVQQVELCSGNGVSCAAPTPWPANGCTAVAPGQTTVPNLLGGLLVPGGMTLTFSTGASGGDLGAQGPDQYAQQQVICPPPTGFDVVQSATDPAGQYWNVDVAPSWTPPVPATVCVHYTPNPAWAISGFNECRLQLFHGSTAPAAPPCSPRDAGWQQINNGGATAVCPSSGHRCDTSFNATGAPCTADTICGTVTDHFSPFAVFAPSTAATPVVSVPANITVNATDPSGAVVSFTASATDPHDGSLTPACSPASGSTFPVGTTTVVCTATDSLGIPGVASFTVTVVAGAAPPVFPGAPGTVVAYATSTAGATVNYTAPAATSANGGPATVTCAPVSGSTFRPGKSTVTCTASDAGGTATTSFTVWVQYQAPADGSFFLLPLLPKGNAVFPICSLPLPVRFRLTGASAGITNLVATFSQTKISNTVTGTVSAVSDEILADTGTTFTYRPLQQAYSYRWKVAGQTQGTYQITANLGDGVTHQIDVSLKAPR